ncbi:MAG: hypothetical protein AAGF84_08720 [Planctomycetota bacterium]
MSDYLPHQDQALAEWTRRFVVGVVPAPERYGLGTEQVAELDAAQRAFAEALAVATRPDTRTKPAVRRKDAARQAMIPRFRRAAQAVQAHPDTTNETRAKLGLTIRKPRVRQAAVPSLAPELNVEWRGASQVQLTLRPNRGTRLGRPAGTKGATWFYFVGDRPTETMADWAFGGNTIETRFRIALPDLKPGAKVWFTAGWFNDRLMMGPVCAPVRAHMAGGGIGGMEGDAVVPICGMRVPEAKAADAEQRPALRVAA